MLIVRFTHRRKPPRHPLALALFIGCGFIGGIATADTIAQTSERSPWHSFITLGAASETVHHGVSLSDNQLTPDAKLVVQHRTGLFASLWATRVDLAGLITTAQSRQWQLAYDLGYNLHLGSHWSLSANHTWYRYTDSSSTSTNDYDYNAWTAAVHYGDYVSLLYSTTDELWGFDVQQDNVSIVVRYPFSSRFIGELELGSIDHTSYVTRDYQFARLNLGYLHGQWSTQLQYHYSSNEAQQLYRQDRVGSHLVAKVAYHFSIR